MFNAVPEGLSRHLLRTRLGNNTSIDTPFSSHGRPCSDRFPASKPPLHLTVPGALCCFTNDPHYALTQADITHCQSASSETRSPVAYNTSSMALSRAPVADQLMVPVINVRPALRLIFWQTLGQFR